MQILALGYERELEMAVDSTDCGAYAIQFFQDLSLYGIDEAVLYLRNFLGDKIGDKEADERIMVRVLPTVKRIKAAYEQSQNVETEA